MKNRLLNVRGGKDAESRVKLRCPQPPKLVTRPRVAPEVELDECTLTVVRVDVDRLPTVRGGVTELLRGQGAGFPRVVVGARVPPTAGHVDVPPLGVVGPGVGRTVLVAYVTQRGVRKEIMSFGVLRPLVLPDSCRVSLQ